MTIYFLASFSYALFASYHIVKNGSSSYYVGFVISITILFPLVALMVLIEGSDNVFKEIARNINDK